MVQFQLLLGTQESVSVNNSNPSKFVDKTESFDRLERILAVSLTILSSLSRLGFQITVQATSNPSFSPPANLDVTTCNKTRQASSRQPLSHSAAHAHESVAASWSLFGLHHYYIMLLIQEVIIMTPCPHANFKTPAHLIIFLHRSYF